MKIIYNSVFPKKKIAAINLFGFVFARKEYNPLSARIKNHESIHTAQMKELFYIFFYLWYGIEWLILWVGYGFKSNKAYKNISFEKEAYSNDNNPDYLKSRKRYSFFSYFSY